MANALQKLKPPRTLVLTIDEVEELLPRAARFPDFLRAVTETVNAPVLVLLSGIPNSYLALSKAGSRHKSMARVIDEPIRLTPFDKDEFESFLDWSISLLNRQSTVLTRRTSDFNSYLYRLSGGHPQVLHKLGGECMLKLRETTPVARERLLDSALLKGVQSCLETEASRTNFNAWLSDLEQDVQRILITMATYRGKPRSEVVKELMKKNSNDSVVSALRQLEGSGLVDSELSIFSLAFANWIRTNSKTLGAAVSA